MPNRVCLYSSEPCRPGEDILVYYETESAGHHCVALYPENAQSRSGFLTYQPAPDRAGVVRFSGTSTEAPGRSIAPGRYVVRLLPWPVDGEPEAVPPLPEPEAEFELLDSPHFLVDSFTTANTVVGETCTVPLADIVTTFRRTVSYEKHSGDDWLTVDAGTGVITGEPPETAAGQAGHIVVTARDAAAPPRTTSVAVTIPVRDAQSPLADRLRVATWNLWYDATQVWNGEDKVLRFLLEQDVDLVAFQEVHRYREPGTARRLAERLGWHVHEYPRIHKDPVDDKDVALISRYPIDQDGSGHGTEFLRSAVRIGDLTVQVCTVHLDYRSYGPDAAPPGKRRYTEEVDDTELQSKRQAEMEEILDKLDDRIRHADDSPVILLGDFNCPSHLDWVADVADVPRFGWPATYLLQLKGFEDSYRACHPDPGAHPGLTWSPTALWRTGLDRVEPQDRIDFIFHLGPRLSPLDSRAWVTGHNVPAEEHSSWKNPPRFHFNDWPSDHAAVITTYRIGQP